MIREAMRSARRAGIARGLLGPALVLGALVRRAVAGGSAAAALLLALAAGAARLLLGVALADVAIVAHGSTVPLRQSSPTNDRAASWARSKIGPGRIPSTSEAAPATTATR